MGSYKVSHSWQVWWHILVIIEKLKQEGYKLESILGYITRYCLKNKVIDDLKDKQKK